MTRRDPHRPVLVGAGEVVRRPGDGGPTWPAELMAEAVRSAVADAGSERLLGRVGAVGAAPSIAWPDGDPARRVAELLGVSAAHTLRTAMQGGNGPQLLVNALAARIQDGALDAAIVCGGEALHTVAELARGGGAPDWPAAEADRRPDELVEPDRAGGSDDEAAVGMIAPIVAYPLIENAIRAAAGRSSGEQLERVARVWSGFSEVAATQPAAWSRTVYGAEHLRTPTPANRLVTLPYTKLLNANIQVDQAAALVLCSEEVAEGLGIPRERWIHVHAGAQANDVWCLSRRRELHRSPAIRACGRAALGHAGADGGDLGPVDLYSCFPSAVQLAAAELGLPFDDPARPLTCTGGLTFFGGPGNGYATHGIAAVARRLREAPRGERGLATAMGWYATKHALGVYGNEPGDRPFASLDAEPERAAAREVAPPADAEATAETCTVVYDRAGTPTHGVLFALLDDGRRALCRTDDAAVMAAMADDGFLGSRVRVRADRSFMPV